MKAIFLFLLMFSFSTWLHAEDADCEVHHCAIVVDAGSTKSRLHLYQYDLSEMGQAMHIESKASYKVTPGLANVSVDAVQDYFDQLFSKVTLTHVPVYVYATAGMRLLPKADQNKRYQAVNQWFSLHPNYALKSAKTMTGKEEGVYGWLAANYQVGRLTADGAFMGVMDMGGASVQVTFPVEDQAGIPAEDAETIHINGRIVHLFSHSFLGLGFTEIVHQLMDESSCYAAGYQLANGNLGTGDAKACGAKFDYLLQAHGTESHVKQILTQHPIDHWYVLGGLSSFAKSYPFHFEDHQLTPEALLTDGVPYFCQTPWAQLIGEHPDDPYLATDCLDAVYFNHLLVTGYGLPAYQKIQFSLDEATDDWTIGIILKQPG